MENLIIVFSGMPASGKDTVSERLHQLDSRYVYFKKFRAVGPEDKPKDSYFNVSADEFEKKINNGDFLQYHGRYGRYYGIAEETLKEMLSSGLIPVIHIGRIENFYTLKNNIPEFEKKHGFKVRIVHIQLWETKEVLRERILKRDKTAEETSKRTEAMEQEFADAAEMMKKGEKPFTIVIKNTDIENTCRTILSSEQSDDGYELFCSYLKTL